MSLTSCNYFTKRKAADILTQLKTAVETKNRDAITNLYPAAAGVDSMNIGFDLDNLKYEMVNDTLVASDDAGHAFYFDTKSDTLCVVDSKGIFYFPAYRMKFAKGTGQYKEGLRDVELSKRMNDRAFDDYVLQKLRVKYANPISVGEFVVTQDIFYAMDTGEGYVPVTNHSDIAFRASDYEFRYKYTYYYAGMDNEETESRTLKGVDLEPGETGRMTMNFNGHGYPHSYVIKYHISDQTLMDAFTPNGNEYDEYLAANGGAYGGEGKAQLTGHKTFSGHIGKYSVKGTLDFTTGNAFTGKYGYHGKTDEEDIEGTLMADGQMVVTESEDGEICGNYRGTLKGSQITGKFTNGKGQQFDFVWNIE